MKILITGGSGLLGSSLTPIFSEFFDVSSTYNKFPFVMDGSSSYELDITNKNDVLKLVEKIRPDVIIHTAALTDVEFCELNQGIAYKINVEGTKNISEAGKKFSSKIAYISTDYVFDGFKGNYTEKSPTNPINYYGKTKLNGEFQVQDQDDSNLIFRTSLYGWNIQNKLSFAEWILINLKKGIEINLIKDQYSSLMFINDFAKIILKLVENDKTGLYNIASCEKISKYEFAKSLANVFDLDKTLINPISGDELSLKLDHKAARPKDVSLNVDKVNKVSSTPSIVEGLENMKRSEKI